MTHFTICLQQNILLKKTLYLYVLGYIYGYRYVCIIDISIIIFHFKEGFLLNLSGAIRECNCQSDIASHIVIEDEILWTFGCWFNKIYWVWASAFYCVKRSSIGSAFKNICFQLPHRFTYWSDDQFGAIQMGRWYYKHKIHWVCFHSFLAKIFSSHHCSQQRKRYLPLSNYISF